MINEYENPYGNVGYYPNPQETATLVMQTNPAAIIEDIEHNLKNERWNDTNKEWKMAEGATPLLNDKGVNMVLTIVKGIVNTNTILSNLNEREIANLIRGLGHEIVLLLESKYDQYEIDKANLTTIVELVCRMSYSSLKRAYGQGERKFLTTTVRTHETVALRPQNEERRISSKIGNVFKNESQ